LFTQPRILTLVFIIITILKSDELNPKPLSKPKLELPKECKTIPPMIIFLPPPMEKELIPCKNVVFKPSIKRIQKKFKNKIKTIEITPGFERVYTLIFENNETLFCNKEITQCIKGNLTSLK